MSQTFKRPTARRPAKQLDEHGLVVQRFPAGYVEVRHPNGAVTMKRLTPKVKGKAAVKFVKRQRQRSNG